MTTIASEIERLQTAKADIKLALEDKGVVVDPAATLDSYDTYVESVTTTAVEAEEKDINFYDYDGFRIDSWSLDELNNKTELPENPMKHDGLVFEEWNWTLQQLKAHNDRACVGALYKTIDNKTKLYLDIPTDNETVNLRLVVTSGAILNISWGDGETETYTSESSSTHTFTHRYGLKGKYVVELEIPNPSINDGISFQGDNPSSGNKFNMFGEIMESNYYMFNFLYRVELSGTFGNHLNKSAFNRLYNLRYFVNSTTSDSPGAYTFYDCEGLECIILSKNTTTIGTYAFELCQAIKIISIPYTVSEIKTDAFRKCYVANELTFPNNSSFSYIGEYAAASCNCLKHVIIPNSSLIQLESYAYAYLYGVRRIDIPSNVVSIAANTFKNDYSLKEIHFRGTTPPSVANANAFSNLPTSCIIYIPRHTMGTYTSATNYPSSSTYTYIEEGPYEPSQEDLALMNNIIGIDSSDPVTYDVEEDEVNEILDDIIGGNE